MPRKYVKDMTPEEREAHRKQWHFVRAENHRKEMEFYRIFANGPMSVSVSSYPRGGPSVLEDAAPPTAPE